MAKTITIGGLTRWFGVCGTCRHALPPLETTATQYFREGTVECIGCHERVDLWESSRAQVDDEFPPEWALHALGAQMTVFPIEVTPGKIVTADLTQHGVPADAVLLHVSYQAHDGRALLRPVELYARHMARSPKHQAVYCMPLPGASSDPGAGRGFVFWFAAGSNAESSIRLARAFGDLADRDFIGSVVEAFSAFETELSGFVIRYVDKRCSSALVSEAIERRLNAHSMMAEWLPGICGELGVRPLDAKVVDGLHRLRRCRNGILHRGGGADVTPSLAGEYLAAALIGVAFVRYLAEAV